MKKMITIPNFLSILRLLMIPIIIFLIFQANKNLFFLMIGSYFFAIFLDFLDGFIARKFSLETELGRILDPLADKLMVLSLLVALVIKTDFPVWLAILIIFRDFLILLVSFFLYQGKKIVLPSLPVGKVTFAIISLVNLIYIIALHEDFSLFLVKKFLSILCFAFIIWSGFEYFQVFAHEENG